MTPHALQRIEQRGGDPDIIAAAAKRAARRTPLPLHCRVALDIPYAPEVVPVIETRPRREIVVITVLRDIPRDRPVVSV